MFFHAVRLPDGSGYKVILEAAPADMYDKDLEVSVAAMSRELAKYVRAYPSQYMWSMKRFKNRPDGEKNGTEERASEDAFFISGYYAQPPPPQVPRDSMDNQRQYPRTPLKCRIRISHPLFGELMAQTRDLSDTGVYVKHPELTQLPTGSVVTGQVQDLPIDAPILQMEVVRVDAEGVGLRFLSEA